VDLQCTTDAMTILAMSGYVSMACIPSFLYYSSAVKKRSLLVVIALASCTSALVFWFIVLGVAQGADSALVKHDVNQFATLLRDRI